MEPLLGVIMRIAAQVVRGDLTELRNRVVRSLVVLGIILVLLGVALATGTTALAIALADLIGLVPALLCIAAVALVAALILALTISARLRRSGATGFGLLGSSKPESPRVDPLLVVVGALAIGLLLGRRKG